MEMDNFPQESPCGAIIWAKSLSDIYRTVICKGDGGDSRAPVGVTLDADGGTNRHDVVYPPQASQHSVCGMLPPPTSWPVNRLSCRNDYFAGHPVVPLAVISHQGDGGLSTALGRATGHRSHHADVPSLEGPHAERG